MFFIFELRDFYIIIKIYDKKTKKTIFECKDFQYLFSDIPVNITAVEELQKMRTLYIPGKKNTNFFQEIIFIHIYLFLIENRELLLQ